MKTIIEDLPIEALKKSPTFLRYFEAQGMCARCKEWTEVLAPCCADTVYFEGGTENACDLWEQIETELREASVPDYDAEAKDRRFDFGGER